MGGRADFDQEDEEEGLEVRLFTCFECGGNNVCETELQDLTFFFLFPFFSNTESLPPIFFTKTNLKNARRNLKAVCKRCPTTHQQKEVAQNGFQNNSNNGNKFENGKDAAFKVGPSSPSASPLASSQKPTCKFFLKNSCTKGNECTYSHDLGNAKQCKFHMLGYCKKGKNCSFLHLNCNVQFKEIVYDNADSKIDKIIQMEMELERQKMLQLKQEEIGFFEKEK